MKINKILKVGYFADGPWSHKAFEKLIKDTSIEIKFIVPRNDTADLTLKNAASKNNIPYIIGHNINSNEFYQLVAKYNCDLFISMSYNQIFKRRILELPKLRTINCHAGKLPYYRGRNILNWVLINDEKEFGITVHYVDEGIDTGDIILQRTYPITDNDTYKTLLEKSYTECAQILYDSVKLVQENKINLIKQNDIHPVGFYCGIRGNGDEIINWQHNSRDIFNFIRAICTPGPMAQCYLKGQQIKINKARLIENAPIYKNRVGQVVGKTELGYIVKTLDSTIEIQEVVSNSKIKIGDKFDL
ncbi:methionyl-tRNA formyltransferase [Labilibacter marinus]|uniref:methionyl-tRNA formyltransferase n=1 Tax=Labilibacter marinus TaxID=1477105 RepID=UPI00094FB2C1|nr:formyltransferase family protein [Labilibacter marinus]